MKDLYGTWASVYDYFYPDRADEIDFWARQAEPFGQRLLDLMCGTAEVSLGLARRGYRVLGLDRSPAMLAMAAQRLAAAADYPARNLSLVQGDVTGIPLAGGQIDFALVGGSGSFNHLTDDPAVATLHELSRALRPGGGLGLELLNPQLLAEIDPQRSFGPLRSLPPGADLRRTTHTRYDQERGWFHIHQVTQYQMGDELERSEERFALRVWGPEQVRELLIGAGFDSVSFYGSYDLEAFDRRAPDLLVIGTRASIA
jgi:SAM-dependent methyltransferase